MDEEMVYWRHPTLPGIKVEEITDGIRYEDNGWLDFAYQIYCENGQEGYRELGHYPDGAPFLYSSDSRISITHCRGLLAIATLAPTPDIDLSAYNPVTALGIDAERSDRSQVLRLRERFLNEAELAAIPAEDLTANVMAWTVKEACYKAARTEGLDFRENIMIERLPKTGPSVTVYDPAEFNYDGSGKGFHNDYFGKATVHRPDGSRIDFILYSYFSGDFIITLAYTSDSCRYSKMN